MKQLLTTQSTQSFFAQLFQSANIVNHVLWCVMFAVHAIGLLTRV